MSHQTNLERIKTVNKALEALEKKIVFVGGATVSLYPDQKVFEIRPTNDVDVIIEIINYSKREQIEERLRAIGFTNDVASGVICRFRIKDIIVDIMPTDDPSIGFKNQWYPAGFEKATEYRIDETSTVKILSSIYFIATKMEAFKHRGKNDGRTSHDFEDIIFVLENRRSIWDELANSDKEVKEYLKKEFNGLLQNPHIEEWIDSHVERSSPPYTYFILEDLRKFCSLEP